MVRQLSAPSISGETIDVISTAIDNRWTKEGGLVSNLERTTERDALPQAVDYLVRLEGVQTAIVFGLTEDGIHISARSPDQRVHVGVILNEAFKDVGSGGGHHDAPGGKSRSVSLQTQSPMTNSYSTSSNKSLPHVSSRNSIFPTEMSLFPGKRRLRLPQHRDPNPTQ